MSVTLLNDVDVLDAMTSIEDRYPHLEVDGPMFEFDNRSGSITAGPSLARVGDNEFALVTVAFPSEDEWSEVLDWALTKIGGYNEDWVLSGNEDWVVSDFSTFVPSSGQELDVTVLSRQPLRG